LKGIELEKFPYEFHRLADFKLIKEEFIGPKDLKLNENVTHLSACDQYWSCAYVPIGFRFESQLDPGLLAESLSQTLNDFPEAAGRIDRTQGTYRIIGAAGVLFQVLKWNANVVAPGEDDSKLRWMEKNLVPFAVTYEPLEKKPLLVVRLSLFGSGISTLGFTWNHGLGDASTINRFLKMWSNCCRKMSSGDASGKPDHDLLFAPRSIRSRIKESTATHSKLDFSALSRSYSHSFSGPLQRFSLLRNVPPMLWKIFTYQALEIRISSTKLRILKDSIIPHLPAGAYVSTLEILMAGFLAATCALNGRPYALRTLINLRSRSSRYEVNYAGNAMAAVHSEPYFYDLTAMDEEHRVKYLAGMASDIHESIHKALKDSNTLFEKGPAWDELVRKSGLGGRSFASFFYGAVKGHFALVNSWNSYPWFDVDFACGKAPTTMLLCLLPGIHEWIFYPTDSKTKDIAVTIAFSKKNALKFVELLNALLFPIELVDSYPVRVRL
jgi:hypothetical protein